MTDKTDDELHADVRAAFVRYVELNGGKDAGELSIVLDEMAKACVDVARASRQAGGLWLPIEVDR